MQLIPSSSVTTITAQARRFSTPSVLISRYLDGWHPWMTHFCCQQSRQVWCPDTGIAQVGCPDTGVAREACPDTGIAQVGCLDTGIAAALETRLHPLLWISFFMTVTRRLLRDPALGASQSEMQKETQGHSQHIVDWSLVFHNHWWPHCGHSSKCFLSRRCVSLVYSVTVQDVVSANSPYWNVCCCFVFLPLGL